MFAPFPFDCGGLLIRALALIVIAVRVPRHYGDRKHRHYYFCILPFYFLL